MGRKGQKQGRAKGEGTWLYKPGRAKPWQLKVPKKWHIPGAEGYWYRSGRIQEDARDAMLDCIKAAKKEEEDRLAALVEAAKPPYFGAYFEEWLAGRTELRPSSRIRYRSVYEHHVKPALERKRLHEIKASDVNAMLDAMKEKGLSASHRQSARICVSACLETAMRGGSDDSGFLDRNPAKKCDPIPFERRPPKNVPLSSLSKILAALEGDPDGGIFLLIGMTGIRLGEALAMRWSDLDFEEGVLQIAATRSKAEGGGYRRAAPKTGMSRRKIPIAPPLKKMLRARREERALEEGFSEEEYLFPSKGDPRRLMSHSLAQDALRRICKRAGVSRVTPHQFRHTFATLLIDSGADPKTVQELLGHSDIKMTLGTYYHTSSERKAQAVDSLSALFAAPEKEAE